MLTIIPTCADLPKYNMSAFWIKYKWNCCRCGVTAYLSDTTEYWYYYDWISPCDSCSFFRKNHRERY